MYFAIFRACVSPRRNAQRSSPTRLGISRRSAVVPPAFPSPPARAVSSSSLRTAVLCRRPIPSASSPRRPTRPPSSRLAARCSSARRVPSSNIRKFQRFRHLLTRKSPQPRNLSPNWPRPNHKLSGLNDESTKVNISTFACIYVCMCTYIYLYIYVNIYINKEFQVIFDDKKKVQSRCLTINEKIHSRYLTIQKIHLRYSTKKNCTPKSSVQVNNYYRNLLVLPIYIRLKIIRKTRQFVCLL